MTQSGDPEQEMRDAYLKLISHAQSGDFLPVPNQGFMEPALLASWDWCNRIFRFPLHGPDAKAALSYHIARPKDDIDLFLFRTDLDSIPISIYEASPFFLVFVPTMAFQGRDVPDRAARVALRLFRLDAPVTFKRIAADRQHESYSTNADLPAAGLGTWSNRIDVVVVGSDLAFVVCKATYYDMMTLVTDPYNWFTTLHPPR